MITRKNIILALTSGLLLGLPWSVTGLFFLVFIGWVPLFAAGKKKFGHCPNPYAVFNYAFVSFLVWNILGTWWVARAQIIGALAIIIANSLVQAFVFWLASRVRTHLRIPMLFPALLIWMGYEHFHNYWDLAWPWLNLGNCPGRRTQHHPVVRVYRGSRWDALGNPDQFCFFTH